MLRTNSNTRSNIDRYFAIWQAVNPNHWFEDIPKDHRLPREEDSGKGPNTGEISNWYKLQHADQLPFRKAPIESTQDKDDPAKWEFWTPDAARTTEQFGYSYPDVDPSKYKDPEDIRDAFAARYGWNRRLEPWQKVGDVPEDMKPLNVESEAQCFRFENGLDGGILPQKPMAEISSIRTTSQAAKDAYFARPKTYVSREYFIDTVVEK